MDSKSVCFEDDSALVSVIVPVYKVSEYLEKCVQSICAQTYQNIEILLVDDGSPDECPEICDDFAREDKRIKVIHKQNGGLSSARNAGIQSSTGEWLMFVDGDDFISPDMVQKLYDAVRLHQAKVSFCTLTAFIEDEDGYREISFWGPPPNGVREGRAVLQDAIEQRKGRLGGHHVIACNKLYQRSLFETLRYPEGQLHEDEATAHYILGSCGKIVGIGDSLYYYRQHENSIMGSANPLRYQSFAMAYGDRILFFHQNGYIGDMECLFYEYWVTLISQYDMFMRDKRCKHLKEKLRHQMAELKRIYVKKPEGSRLRKMVISLFVLFPQLISRLYAWSVRLRSGHRNAT